MTFCLKGIVSLLQRKLVLACTVQWSCQLNTSEGSVSQTRNSDVLVVVQQASVTVISSLLFSFQTAVHEIASISPKNNWWNVFLCCFFWLFLKQNWISEKEMCYILHNWEKTLSCDCHTSVAQLFSTKIIWKYIEIRKYIQLHQNKKLRKYI